MRDSELKEKLNSAMSSQVPDVLDKIMQQCDTVRGEQTMANVITMEKKRKKPIYKIATAMAAMAAVFALAIGATSAISGARVNQVATVVSFDVNPSIEIEANQEEKVVNVKALNEDAEKVIDNMNLKKVDLDVAINAILGSMLKQGYLSVDSNSILVTVDCKDEEKAEVLRQNISADVETILAGSNIEASVITQIIEQDDEKNAEAEEIASRNQISKAKATLIAKITKAGLTDAEGKPYTNEQLAVLTVNELKLLLESKDVKIENVESSGQASETLYIGQGEARNIAYADAGFTPNTVKNPKIEMDSDKGKMVYEVEFEYDGFAYDYEIDAMTGEILSAEKTELPPEEVQEDTDKKEDKENNGNNGNSGNKEDKPQMPDFPEISGMPEMPELTGVPELPEVPNPWECFEHWKDFDNWEDFEAYCEKYWEQYGDEWEGYADSWESYLEKHEAEWKNYGSDWKNYWKQYGNEWKDYGKQWKDYWKDYESKWKEYWKNNENGSEAEWLDKWNRWNQAEQGGNGNFWNNNKPNEKAEVAVLEEDAQKLAYEHAGITAEDVIRIKCKLEEDDGVYYYEMEFCTETAKYEYEVNAMTGEILDAETEDCWWKDIDWEEHGEDVKEQWEQTCKDMEDYWQQFGDRWNNRFGKEDNTEVDTEDADADTEEESKGNDKKEKDSKENNRNTIWSLIKSNKKK